MLSKQAEVEVRPLSACRALCKPEQKKPPATADDMAEEGWRKWTRSGPQNGQQNEQMKLTDADSQQKLNLVDSQKLNLVDGDLLELDAKEKLS